MAFASFEEIDAWRQARKLVRMVRVFCRRDPAKRDWGWVDQISRASLSIMANIAEGNDAQTDIEFATFLGYAKRSTAEVRSHLYYGLDEEYLSRQEFDESAKLCKLIAAELMSLIAYLRSHTRADRSVHTVHVS